MRKTTLTLMIGGLMAACCTQSFAQCQDAIYSDGVLSLPYVDAGKRGSYANVEVEINILESEEIDEPFSGICVTPRYANGELSLPYMSGDEGDFINVKADVLQILNADPIDSPPPIVSTITPLNDTGIVFCDDDDVDNELDCLLTDPAGQDAEYGRDVTNNDDSDGHAGFSFTKLDADGADLPASATEWFCVRDNVTGLIWEVKTDDGGLRNMDWTYSWYNPDSRTNGGDGGAQNDGSCGNNTCDTYAFVQAVNADEGLCGATDWRLPNREELRSIVNYGQMSPAIDAEYFPNTISEKFWSSSSRAYYANQAWTIHFENGRDGNYSKRRVNHVRLVRAGE